MKTKTSVVLASILFLTSQAIAETHTSLAPTKQVLLVIAEHNDQPLATVYRVQAIENSWQYIGTGVRAVVGKNGVNKTKEGDGRAPSGRFSLVDSFGYSGEKASTMKMPYRAMSADAECVDDVASTAYNRIVNQSSARAFTRWNSSEHMRRDLFHNDDLYKWGLVVSYNTEHPVQHGVGNNKGSCIFIHIWRSPLEGTAGCTALSEPDLLTILNWLDPTQQPQLIQGTRAQLDAMTLPFALPSLSEL